MQQEAINKSIIRDFYRRVVSQGDLAYADEIIADDYIQHSSMVKPGKAGLMEALGYMKQMPKPATTSTPFMRLIAEGDYVITNLSFGWDGRQKVVVDLFRFRDGKVAEHWDAVQDQPETTENGHSMMDGTAPIDDRDLTATNKKTVSAFFQQVFVDGKIGALPDFVATDLIQHNPEIADGLVGLQRYLREKSGKLSITEVHHVIGEGDFVVIQSSGQVDQKPGMFYDIFRLNKGKIVEQWGVKQFTL